MTRNLFAGRPRSGGLRLSVFNESELEDIHQATLEVLERTGVFVEAVGGENAEGELPREDHDGYDDNAVEEFFHCEPFYALTFSFNQSSSGPLAVGMSTV